MKRPSSHLIADCRLRDDEVWVTCTCGVTVTGDDAETLNPLYQRHRMDGGAPRGEAGMRHDGIHGQSWKNGGNGINPANREAARRYYARNREQVLERQRLRYRAQKVAA